MKSIAKAILVSGFMLTAQAAVTNSSAFPGSAPEGYFLDPNVTYASQHASNPVTSANSAIPGSAPEGYFLDPNYVCQ